MVNRVSALASSLSKGHFGVAGQTGVTLTEVPDLSLVQIAAWPDTLATVAEAAVRDAKCDRAPGLCRATEGAQGSLLRIEPLKWWLVGSNASDAANKLAADQGAVLDLSHSRTHLRVSGEHATTLLNRHLPLDLREHAFPLSSVASTAFHHVGITLWRSSQGYELFLPRGFAVSLWEGLLESAEQFGVDVV